MERHGNAVPNTIGVLKNGSKADASVATELEVLSALANLHLPHMPETARSGEADAAKDSAPPLLLPQSMPSITILVCADIDLKSSSALAEYTLQQKNRIFDASAIDLIIAAGPCTRGDSDLSYYSSQMGCDDSYRAPHNRAGGGGHEGRRRIEPHAKDETIADNHSDTHDTNDVRSSRTLSPFFRTREESAGLEGLLTASISQLESIVCRVVYCPGWHDPLAVLHTSGGSGTNAAQRLKRLTTNSRNIHQQWLPLAPGLGCAGLFYLDGTDALENRHTTSERPPNDDDSDASDEQDGVTTLLEQVKKLQCPSGYTTTLSKLLQLAPRPSHDVLFASNAGSSKCQSILVTHYVDCRSLLQRDNGDNASTGTPPPVDTKVAASNNDNTVVPSDAPSDVQPSLPWPSDYDAFMRCETTQQHLCFEIASGSAVHVAPEWIKTDSESAPARNNVTIPTPTTFPVLLPGSLRERGEFSIVQLSLVEQKPGRHLPLPSRRFAWKVQNVDFHHINNFGQRSCH